jgi:uncharacterized damage-inducible protein DinB
MMPRTSERLNPYAPLLGERDPFEVLDHTADHLRQITTAVEASQLARRPAPGKWSIRDILCHLADTEIVFGFRLRQTMAEAHHVIQPFDQDAWAAPAAHLDARAALDAFAAIRTWNLLFARAVIPGALEKPVTHPERGTMTFQAILETMAGHDVNHTRQIDALAKRQ